MLFCHHTIFTTAKGGFSVSLLFPNSLGTVPFVHHSWRPFKQEVFLWRMPFHPFEGEVSAHKSIERHVEEVHVERGSRLHVGVGYTLSYTIDAGSFN
jgi:hypothetical protein